MAGLIAQAPTVHDSYFVGERLATHDELTYTMGEHPSIFRCKTEWGCFWQEHPEEAIALYRELMSSPVFGYIHTSLWHREMVRPRLIAWNEADQKRLPEAWKNFTQELEASTNVLLRMEAKALAMSDATNAAQAGAAKQDWWSIVRSNREELVANNVELFYLGWGMGYDPEAEALDQEYWDHTVRGGKTRDTFAAQKQFLKENKPFDFIAFANAFQQRSYSQTQALELQPLITAYKSNLVAQADSHDLRMSGALSHVGFLEKDVNRIANPPPANPQPLTASASAKPAPVLPLTKVIPSPTRTPEAVTNVMTVDQFLAIPLESLTNTDISDVKITAHHLFGDKLVLDIQYSAMVYSFNQNGDWNSTRNTALPAIAVLDLASRHWEVIGRPEVDLSAQTRFYPHTVLWRGELFESEGRQISRYDPRTSAWQVLPVSDGENYELFVVNDQLYGANGEQIFEIVDGGKSTRILASTRRQPPMSLLDREDLGMPALFAGPGHSLQVSTRGKIFTWTGSDWQQDYAALKTSLPPVISPEEVLFRTDGFNLAAGITRLGIETNQPEFLVGQKRRVDNPNMPPEQTPLWQLPKELTLTGVAAAWHQESLYLLEDHSEARDIIDPKQHLITGRQMLPQDGYHAALVCFSRDLPLPQKIFLKFEHPTGNPPVAGMGSGSRPSPWAASPAWMTVTTNLLIFGVEQPNFFTPGGGNQRTGMGYQTGIWLQPIAPIESRIAGQKQAQIEEQQRTAAQAEQARKDRFAKIDLNHNGIIDPDEKEAALDDPAFIESQLENIDTNHDGWLEAEELAYFDANQNKILEPKEQKGIELTITLLAQRALKKFDANGNGRLEPEEYREFLNARPAAVVQSLARDGMPAHFFGRETRGGNSPLQELESVLRQQTVAGLHINSMMMTVFTSRREGPTGTPLNQQELFKAMVEFYWQHPGGGVRPQPGR